MSKVDLKKRAVKIKGKDYSLVKDRLLYLREEHEGEYEIFTDYEYIESVNAWVVRATLKLGDKVYTGLAQEVEGGSGVNKTSALENAETSAVGRACAMAGIGILDSIASADEVHKAANRDNGTWGPGLTPKQRAWGEKLAKTAYTDPDTGKIGTADFDKMANDLLGHKVEGKSQFNLLVNILKQEGIIEETA